MIRALFALIITLQMGFSELEPLFLDIAQLKGCNESYIAEIGSSFLLYLSQIGSGSFKLGYGDSEHVDVSLNGESLEEGIKICMNTSGKKCEASFYENIVTIFNFVTTLNSRVSLVDGKNFVKLENDYLVVKTSRVEELTIANEILKTHDTIETLVLNGCNIDEAMIEVINRKETILWLSVKGVDIRTCILWPGVLDKLCEALCWSKYLSSFKLSSSTKPNTLDPIVNLLRSTKLKQLVLHRLSLTDDMIFPLTTFLRDVPSAKFLEVLDLSENSIGDIGAMMLSFALSENPFIKRVYLMANLNDPTIGNFIQSNGATMLISAVRVRNTLEILDLRGNKIGEDLKTEILSQAELGFFSSIFVGNPLEKHESFGSKIETQGMPSNIDLGEFECFGGDSEPQNLVPLIEMEESEETGEWFSPEIETSVFPQEIKVQNLERPYSSGERIDNSKSKKQNTREAIKQKPSRGKSVASRIKAGKGQRKGKQTKRQKPRAQLKRKDLIHGEPIIFQP